MRTKLPFVIERNPQPIKFLHTPEDREELKRKRSIEEIVEIIKDNKDSLMTLVDLAMHNNDIGFGYIELDGDFSIREEGLMFKTSKGEDYGVVHAPDEDAIRIASLPKAKRVVHNVKTREGYSLVISEFQKEVPSDFPMLVVAYFLEAAGIDSLHKLGKIINRGAEIYRRYAQEMF